MRPASGFAIVVSLLLATFHWTDLQPRVDRDFFFSAGSHTLDQTERIERLFRGHGQLVVIAESPDIASAAYLKRVASLEERLARVGGVRSSRSVASGPGDLGEAEASPLWRRLLLSEDGSATHLILFVDDPTPDALIPRVEAILAERNAPGFSLSVAGIPYTVVMMQRLLVRDFSVFSVVAVAGFALASLVLFGSIRIAFAVVATCSAAVAITFLTLDSLGASLGLLSANLVTIVFVLTQSHLVFLTSNWRQLAVSHGPEGSIASAVRETLRPSIASMATTLLGFGTLLFVDAKPLRELGVGGVTGSLAAFAVAYLLYPLFLAGARPKPASGDPFGRIRDALARRRSGVAVGCATACLLVGSGLVWLDTDPSLLEYFDDEGEIYRTLDYLDRNTGSAPLQLVLQRTDAGDVLEGDAAYAELWEVQAALEAEPTVGRVVSLPVVLAEGERSPLSFLVSHAMMLRLLESPLFDRIGESFVTADRTQMLFALHMVEHDRERRRVEVVEHLRSVVAREGFEVTLAGGVFYLQGMLSDLVAESMIESLAGLGALFLVIAWFATGGIRVALAMVFTLALVPVAVFGTMGWFGVPVDVVTAPAASIGLGLAADSLLHLGVAARRAPGGTSGGTLGDWERWVGGIRSQWAGIARASLIVTIGFGLFAFSGFPPTRRFGVAVSAATALAAPLALVVLPALASRVRARADS